MPDAVRKVLPVYRFEDGAKDQGLQDDVKGCSRKVDTRGITAEQVHTHRKPRPRQRQTIWQQLISHEIHWLEAKAQQHQQVATGTTTDFQ